MSVYRVEKVRLLGGALFVASTLATGELVGQFESEHHARQACDFAQRKKAVQGQRWAKGTKPHPHPGEKGRPCGQAKNARGAGAPGRQILRRLSGPF